MTPRIQSIDKLRGLAILLMILDHVLAVLDTGQIWRLTLTRAALPIFMLITGYLLAGRNISPRRYTQLILSAIASSILVQGIPGMVKMDVLVSISIALAFWPLARHAPILALVIGSVQSHTLGIGDGYAPGYILALIATGALLRKASTPPELKLAKLVSAALPTWFANIGTRPLTWYLGHLAILVMFTNHIALHA